MWTLKKSSAVLLREYFVPGSISYSCYRQKMRGKVVLVTGSSSGIGAAIAIEFASQGCRLALTGRKIEGLEETQRACIQAGAKEEDLLLITADIQVHESLAMIVEKTVNKFGKLDVLVNNAGCDKPGSIEQTTAENYDLIMNTNLKSAFFLTQASLPHLLKSQGNVVNISSVAGQRPYQNSIVYCMSKAALDHFTRIVALDVASRNVRVNAVNPAAFKTNFLERAGCEFKFEDIAPILHAMGRGGELQELTKAVLFLADNEQSSFITGVTMLVDGGAYLMGPM